MNWTAWIIVRIFLAYILYTSYSPSHTLCLPTSPGWLLYNFPTNCLWAWPLLSNNQPTLCLVAFTTSCCKCSTLLCLPGLYRARGTPGCTFLPSSQVPRSEAKFTLKLLVFLLWNKPELSGTIIIKTACQLPLPKVECNCREILVFQLPFVSSETSLFFRFEETNLGPVLNLVIKTKEKERWKSAVSSQWN